MSDASNHDFYGMGHSRDEAAKGTDSQTSIQSKEAFDKQVLL
jgi:hypothetical protein